VTQELHVLLTRWKGNGFINELTYKRLLTSDGNIPRAYELIKIHKAGNLLRVIVSSINSLLYDFFPYLHNIIIKSISQALNYIKDSFHLVEKLWHSFRLIILFFDSNYILASLDVVSLFTNVLVDLALNSIEKRWDHIFKNKHSKG